MQKTNDPAGRAEGNEDARLPSLKAVAAFEATARLGSMTAAARELRSTQPAISQRIRALEDTLGLPLFDRTAGRLRLTRSGLEYQEQIAASLRRIIGATRRLQSRAHARHRDVMLAVSFGFAHRWLLPRMGRLESAFPGTQFEVFPVDREDSPEMTGADLTIRFGWLARLDAREWPLFGETVFPVCSPGCARDYDIGEELDAPALAGMPMLHLDHRDARWLDWSRWCGLAGLDPPVRLSRFHYNNYPLLLNAAVEGRGVALGWAGLVESMIEEGTLIRLGPVVERSDFGYMLGARNPGSAIISAVVDWFRRESDAGRSTARAANT